MDDEQQPIDPDGFKCIARHGARASGRVADQDSPVAQAFNHGKVVIALFGYGASLVLAPLSLRFRDIPQLVQNMVQMLFFLTPIFWRGDQLSARHPFVEFNPAHHFIELVRGPLIGVMPSMTSYLFAIGATIVALAAGFVAVHVSRRSIFLWL